MRRELLCKVVLIVLIAAAAGCGATAPDFPLPVTHFDLVYSSQTPLTDHDRIEEETSAQIHLADNMQYVGIIPDINDVSDKSPPLPPTVLNSLCTSFMTDADPDVQSLCGTPTMLKDYLTAYRDSTGITGRLMLCVSPLHRFSGDESPGATTLTDSATPRNTYAEGIFLYDDMITLAAGVGEPRSKAMAVVGMHELGHLLVRLKHVEVDPGHHNPEYTTFGSIMKKSVANDLQRNYATNPLIFCRTTTNHPDELTTCHGILRAAFNLPYGVP